MPRTADRSERKHANGVRALVRELSETRGHEARSKVRERIRALGRSAAPRLLPFLEHPDDFTRWDVVSLLGEWAHPDTRDAVVRFALREDELHARWRAFWSVSRFDRTETVPRLLSALRGKNATARWRAALVLSMLGRREAGPVLTRGLRSRDPWIRWEAVSAIKTLRYAHAVRGVRRLLEPGEPDAVRREATLALGAIGTPAALRRLERALADPDAEVRWRASMALARNGPDCHAKLRERLAVEPDARVRAQIRDDLNRSGGRDG